MAFKGESDDIRSSLAYKLKRILRFKAAGVLCTDPYVKVDPDLVPLEEVLDRSDLLDHRSAPPGATRLADRQTRVDIWGLRAEVSGYETPSLGCRHRHATRARPSSVRSAAHSAKRSPCRARSWWCATRPKTRPSRGSRSTPKRTTVYAWCSTAMVLARPGRSGPASTVSGRCRGRDDGGWL